MYKKVYLEITNNCNLDCSFCIKNNRIKKFISISDFKIILNKLKNYTNYLYFHVMGEPLLHPNINKLIDLAKEDFKINITTNGYLIDRIKDNKNIRQINISLHSYNSKYHVSLDKYLDNICNAIDKLCPYTYFALRFWVNNPYNKDIIKYLEERYNIKVELVNNYKIKDNVFISINKEFIWPDLNNNYENKIGKCYALKDHIGILVNGDIVPCCLDANGIIKLGNIFTDNIDDIIKSKRYQSMLDGFKNNQKIEKLCQTCNFLE